MLVEVFGVAAPESGPDPVAPTTDPGVDDTGANRLKLPADFCSSASARRLRKSLDERRPTVCEARRSAAVEAWEVNRVVGVGARVLEVEEGSVEAMILLSFRWIRKTASLGDLKAFRSRSSW